MVELHCVKCGLSTIAVIRTSPTAVHYECVACGTIVEPDTDWPPLHCRQGRHDWHLYGSINGRPYYGCQTCGAEEVVDS